MSIQRDTSFEPIINEYMIENFTSINKNQCLNMCLRIFGCKLVMYSTADGTCTIYNSTNGILNSLDEYIIYTVEESTTTVTDNTTTSTITTTTFPTTTSIKQVTSQAMTSAADDTGEK